ncbi:MAG: DUF11 domain-containing protein [Planctomycetaceae bacterium]|nr:DUF11 domain-containing protein [Planctomycetaceae bacterium]
MKHQRIHSGRLTTDNGPRSAPAWFRYGVIAAAAIVMCSCRTAEPRYRIAQNQPNPSSADSQLASSVPNDVQDHVPGAQHVAPENGSDNSEQVVFADDSQDASANLRQPVDVQPAAFADDSSASLPARGLAPSAIRLAAAEIPTHLTGAQLAQSQCLPEGNWQPMCSGDGCGCCNHGPVRGPADEYLCDGGDMHLPAAVNAEWKVTGLEQEDTVAHYDTVDGRTIITPSNKVCLYAPRFAAVREVTDLRAYARIDAPGGTIQKINPIKIEETEDVLTSLAEIQPDIHREKEPPSLLREREQAGELDRDRRVAVTIGALQPYCNVQLIRSGEVIGTDVVKIARASLAAIAWSGVEAAQVVLDGRHAQAAVSDVSPGTIYHLFEPNNPKLRLVKLASKSSAQPGEEVEFTLRFDNVGDKVIGNVVITDNLTTRLEYVEGSQKTSLPASFTTQANDGESLILRWELTEPLEKGKGGVIQFRCKVR